MKVLFCCLLTVFLVGLVSSVGFANAYVWTGNAADDNWGTNGNWDQAGAPGADDTATIGYVADHNVITITAEVESLTSLTVNASATDTQDITLIVSANLGATSAPSIDVNITGSGDVTITGSLAINATTITIDAAGNTGMFSLSGAGTTTTSGAVSITSGAGDYTLDRSGAWSVGGTMGLTASGAGSITMTLGANSDFMGKVTLTAGAGAGNTTLDLGTVNGNFDGDLEFASGGGSGGTPQLDLGSGSHTLAGSFTNVAIGVLTKGSSTLTFDGGTGKTLTSCGDSFNNLTLDKADVANTLTLQDALDVDGKLTITQGTLVFGDNKGEHHFGGNFEIQTNGRVTKGTGTTVLVFDGTTNLTDNSGGPQNLGAVKVD